jgi:hypothetical protein
MTTLLARWRGRAKSLADPLISPDHVHPNESGHMKIAEIFATATPATDRFLK